jgi:hypothetical protein
MGTVEPDGADAVFGHFILDDVLFRFHVTLSLAKI